MEKFLLITSVLLFISTFGIYSIMHNTEVARFGSSTIGTSTMINAFVSGFILPIFPLIKIFDMNYILLFFINIPVVLILSPLITKGIILRFASGDELSRDMYRALIAGIISMVIGLSIE